MKTISVHPLARLLRATLPGLLLAACAAPATLQVATVPVQLPSATPLPASPSPAPSTTPEPALLPSPTFTSLPPTAEPPAATPTDVPLPADTPVAPAVRAAPRLTGRWVYYSAWDKLPEERFTFVAADTIPYVGTDGAGTYWHDAEGWHPFTRGDGLPSDTVTAAEELPDGARIFGTDAGLALKPGPWTPWVYITTTHGLPSAVVVDIDSYGSELWAATWGGVARRGETRWTGYSMRELFGISMASPTCIAVAPGGIWVGSDGAGLLWFDRAGGSSTLFDTARGLPGNHVTDVAAAPGGVVWAATPHGVGRWDGQFWTTYTTAEGLPSDDVRGISVNADGRLWAATARGAASYSARHDAWAGYGPGSGIFATNLTDVAVDRNGVVWFITAASEVVVFVPQ